jgi:uncharacterized membrane protein
VDPELRAQIERLTGQLETMQAQVSQLKIQLGRLVLDASVAAVAPPDQAAGPASPSPSTAAVPAPAPPPLPAAAQMDVPARAARVANSMAPPPSKPTPASKLVGDLQAPPPLPSPRPGWPGVPPPPKPAPRPRGNLEQRLGVNWMSRVGVVVLVLGVVFFFQYAAREGWISPAIRVALAALGGAVLADPGQAKGPDAPRP